VFKREKRINSIYIVELEREGEPWQAQIPAPSPEAALELAESAVPGSYTIGRIVEVIDRVQRGDDIVQFPPRPYDS
jgi:hypothetical protein